MLNANKVRKTFNAGTINEKVALSGASLFLEDGEFCTVIGGNGAGKSTFLNAIIGKEILPINLGEYTKKGITFSSK